jgi:uncharacterized membrane protein YcfT
MAEVADVNRIWRPDEPIVWPPMSTVRHSWIDVVRGTAVILVILVHAMQRTELFTGHEFTRLETLTIIVTPVPMSRASSAASRGRTCCGRCC